MFGGISQALFGDGGAGAAQSAAMAQLQNAQQNYKTISGIGQDMTTQGLANYDKALSAQDKNLSRQEQMVAQIDPTVLAASKQAADLLAGKSASSLAPIQAQRNQQRQQLLSNLRAQLGPGAETSTAGIQALNQFDMQTNSLLAGQQQGALQLANQTFGTFSGYGQGINQSIGQMAQITGARAGLQGNYANMLNAANQGVQQNAGAPYLGDYLRGQQNAAFGRQMLGAAIQGGSMAAMGGFGGGGAGAAGAGAAAGSGSFGPMAGQSYYNAGSVA